MAGSREDGSRGVKDKVLSALLNEMDGIGTRTDVSGPGKTMVVEAEDSDSVATKPGSSLTSTSTVLHGRDVLVVCATNRPWALDSALCRPGRLDRLILVPPPSNQVRVQMLRQMASPMPLADEVDLEAVALAMPPMASGADLENLCREVAMIALTRGGQGFFLVVGLLLNNDELS